MIYKQHSLHSPSTQEEDVAADNPLNQPSVLQQTTNASSSSSSEDALKQEKAVLPLESPLAPTRAASPPLIGRAADDLPTQPTPLAYPYFTYGAETQVTQGDLPHWQQEEKIVFVTYRLADSIPLHAQKEYKESIEAWRVKHKLALTIEEDQQLQRLKLMLMEQLLNKSLGSCVLKQAKVRLVVSESFHHFNHQRYHIHDFVIMPNYVHVLVEPIKGYDVKHIVSTWKSYTAHRINQLLQRQGEVWQRESFDRIIRNEQNYWNVVNYIARNLKHCRDGEYEIYLTNGRPDFKPVSNRCLER